MYLLIKAGVASKFELEEYYTLDEALKLYALIKMEQDMKTQSLKSLEGGMNRDS